MRNKRGQESSPTPAVIGIILGIVVLVVLVLGFTIGWNRFLPFINSNNVENIKTACSTACATVNVYDFCSAPKTLKADDLPSGTNGKVPKSVVGNCTFFSTDPLYTKYAISTCLIDCPQ